MTRLLAVDADACVLDGAPVTDWLAALPHLGRIAGAFALAWHDERGDLHLARDPIGHRSLYWGRRRDGSVAWATRLAAVLADGVPRALDPVALASYLATAYVPGTATLVAGVRAVPPGVELAFRPGIATPEPWPFWRLPASPATFASEAELARELRGLLAATVARMLPPGPVAATLSGGIDSSLVVALARQHREVRCLSIGFGPGHRDELAWSARVAAHVGARHDVVIVRPDDVMARLDRTVGALSEPNGDPLTVPNTMLFEAARAAGHDVVLNGEGGDPSFGGPKNAPLLLAELYGAPDGPLVREQAYLRAHQKLWDELDAVLEPDLRAAVPAGALEALVAPWLADARWPRFLDRLMAINVAWKGSGHILPKVEHLGAAEGVRARSPLFDRDVVGLAFAIPAELKRRGPIEKYLLKEAVRDLLPVDVIERPKSGMMVPVEAWFSGPLAAFARERLLDGLAGRGIVRRDFLERLLDHRGGGLRPRRGVKVWLLLTLESWLRGVYDEPT